MRLPLQPSRNLQQEQEEEEEQQQQQNNINIINDSL